ncbi:hypothetical protein [Cognatiluteimonas weifangensis]|uniref:hypothetical protein n=1 Tax=Cognatiluteimonas weifangensis TaxID=2303539 RepID=UPI0011C19F86|nr:hypothetical protein [Luteimonas weifangensis]
MQNFDRLPTKSERFVGVFASLLLCVAMGAVSYFSARLLLAGKTDAFVVVGLFIGLVLFLWSGRVFLRFVFGSPQVSGPIGQLVVGLLLAAAGSSMVIAHFALDVQDGHGRIGVAGAGLALGVGLVKNAWKRLRQ